MTSRTAPQKAPQGGLRVHAIYTVLNESDLLAASLASIYDFVQGITIITQYDRDWKGRVVEPDSLVDRFLSRSMDPVGKVSLIVALETNEARARNRAMDFASPGASSRRVQRHHSGADLLPEVDYFWIIDADEIYEAATVPRLLRYVGEHRRPYYQVAAKRYFKRWNYLVDGYEWFTAFVRKDHRLGSRRNPYPHYGKRLLCRAPFSTVRLSNAREGIRVIPVEVGVFHHGSYVGPRNRIAEKLAGFSHSEQMDPDWLDTVWTCWDSNCRNFHPVSPAAFPSARGLQNSELPSEIRDWDWPDGYLAKETL